MSKIKSLIEGAHRAVEMRWTVLCYDPEKDNELVESSKQFDCICAAQTHKRELAMKHPGYIIEIVAESKKAKNESIGQEIVDEVKEEIKAELKDAIGQDVDNAIGHPATEENLGAEVKDDMEAEEDELAMEEDIDDDSDSIFAPDDLDEVVGESAEDDFKTKSLGAIAIVKAAGFKVNDRASKNGLIVLDKGDKEVVIGLYDQGILDITAYDKGEDTYSNHWKIDRVGKADIEKAAKAAIKSFNESAQKNEDAIMDDLIAALKQEKAEIQKGFGWISFDQLLTDLKIEHDIDDRDIPRPVIKQKAKQILGSMLKESAQKNEAMPPISQRKRIEFEDDIVKVYDGNKEIYAGAEDYEPMQDENWKWDNTNKYYKFDKYIKVCCESAQKNEAVNAAKVKQDVEKAIKDYFKNDKDALEYVYVDSKKDVYGRTVIEVRAELGYNGMTKLADHLDKVVQKHDRYAYFEQESGGIMTAVFESAQKNEDAEFDFEKVKQNFIKAISRLSINSKDADFDKLAENLGYLKFAKRDLQKGYSKNAEKTLNKVKFESAQMNETNHSKDFNKNIYTTLEKVSKAILKVTDSDYRKAQQTLGYAAICLTALQNYVNHVGQNTDEWLADHPTEADKHYKQAIDAANKL